MKPQLAIEMSDKDFRGIIYIMTAWGKKPA
jgi:hypothetical protein